MKNYNAEVTNTFYLVDKDYQVNVEYWEDNYYAHFEIYVSLKKGDADVSTAFYKKRTENHSTYIKHYSEEDIKEEGFKKIVETIKDYFEEKGMI